MRKKTIIIATGVLSLVIVIGIVYTLLRPNKVISVEPREDAKEIQVNTQLKITFLNKLSQLPFHNYSLNIDPDYGTISKFEKTNDYSLVFKLDKPLQNNKSYKVVIKDNGRELFSWNFKTTATTDEQISTQLEKQLVSELKTGEIYKEYYASKPFIKNFPIDNNDFLIIYSSQDNEIIVGIKHQGNLDELKAQYLQQALDLLLKAKVDTNTEKIVWEVITPLNK